MERFQKIKTARKKLNVDTICRCCGLENDEKYNILRIFEDGVAFKTKISSMIGIIVEGWDGMPQSICAICYDKINDFFEFRLMALNTEKQTREALGIPEPPKKVATPPIVQPSPPVRQIDPKSAVVRLVDLKYSIQDKILIRKAFEKIVNQPTIKERRSESPPVILQPPPAKKSRKDIKCKICSEYFSYQNDLQDHQMKFHLPTIAKYACGSCRETFDQLSDYKAHELYHTKEGLPYECYICLCSFAKFKDFAKHTTNNNCSGKEKLPVLVEDIKCFQCKKKFLTQNLFEWHGCFIKTKGTCSKCGLCIAKKKSLFKHYVLCDGLSGGNSAQSSSFKNEAISPVTTDGRKRPPGRPPGKNKALPARKMTIVKSEAELNMPAVTEANDEDDLDDYNEDNITYDNYGSDDDDESQHMHVEPVVELNHQDANHESGPRIIEIKKEKSFGDEEFDSLHDDGPLTVDKIRRIKREQIAKQQAINIVSNKNPFAVRVKREAENGNEAVVKVLNPFSNSTTTAAAGAGSNKKVFKIPHGLAMKIKKEKNSRSSAVVVRSASVDEADADPEEEAQMQQMATTSIVKQEKIEDRRSAVKQFINPMALAAAAAANVKEKSNGTENNTLVIASVSSIVEEPIIEKKNEEGLKHTSNDEKMMTEIPAEFRKSFEGDDDEQQLLQQQQQPSTENQVLPIPLSIAENNQIDDVVMNNSNDELEKLLENYGSCDIQDDDIQDLLKFD